MSYLSRVQYTGAGNTALYSIPFAYISKAYIEVRVGGSLLTEGVGFSWQSATSILLTSGNLPAGVVLDIRRATPKTARLVDFQDGSVLTEASLDLANDQVFQMVQETVDDMADRLSVQTDGTVDAQSKRIKNVASPALGTDAINKDYADQLALGGLPTPLATSNGGTGLVSPTGLLKGNGASPMTIAAAGTDYVVPSALGTAASKDVGTGVGNVVQVQSGGKLPVLDGSQLTGLSSAAIAGLFRNLTATASGVSSSVAIAADELTVTDGTTYKTLKAVGLTLNSAGSGANGIDTGTLAANTWYALFVIWNGTTPASLMSLSATSPTMPSGYTHKARIGWIRTDGSGNKYPLSFKQFGRSVAYAVVGGSNVPAIPVMASGTQGTYPGTYAAISVTSFVPPSAYQIRAALCSTANLAAGMGPSANYGPVNTLTNPPPLMFSTYPNGAGVFNLESSNFYAVSSGSINILCMGWEDNL